MSQYEQKALTTCDTDLRPQGGKHRRDHGLQGTRELGCILLVELSLTVKVRMSLPIAALWYMEWETETNTHTHHFIHKPPSCLHIACTPFHSHPKSLCVTHMVLQTTLHYGNTVWNISELSHSIHRTSSVIDHVLVVLMITISRPSVISNILKAKHLLHQRSDLMTQRA